MRDGGQDMLCLGQRHHAEGGTPLLGHKRQVPNFRLLVPVMTIASAQPLLQHGLCLGGQVPLPVLRLTEKLHQLFVAGLGGILNIVLSGLGTL